MDVHWLNRNDIQHLHLLIRSNMNIMTLFEVAHLLQKESNSIYHFERVYLLFPR